MTTTTDTITAHVDYVQRLLTLREAATVDQAIRAVITHGQDLSVPTVGRLALISTGVVRRVTLITKVTPTKATASYLTDSALRSAREFAARNPFPMRLDSWPDTYRDQAVAKWQANDALQTESDVNSYADRHYEWALTTQAVYRAVKHRPWVAFAPIRNTTMPHATLVMIPENGDTQ